MQPPRHTRTDLEAENAKLREQVAALSARASLFESRLQSLVAESPDDGADQGEGNVVKWARDLLLTEAMLAESQRQARIGSFELNVATHELTWSEQQFRNFGFEPADTIARERVITRIHPEDLPRHEAVVNRATAHGEAFAIDYRVVHPDGKLVHIHTIAEPVFDPQGRVTKLVGTSQDVTERTLLEEQLRAQYAQLERLGELKSRFFDSVSHELRTPLATVMGYTEFLEDELGGALTPEQRHYVGHIRRGGKRLESLLNDLLDFACMEAGTFSLKLARADLGARIREVLESLHPQLDDAQLSLVTGLPDDPLELEMDPRRIGQVLANLLANAVKFSPRGGTLRVSAFRHGQTIRCEMADDGPGIEAEDVPKLFQRFSQLENGMRTGKGTGLGLAICKALVEAHGGTIGVESTPGVGTTFWFELPLERARREQPATGVLPER